MGDQCWYAHQLGDGLVLEQLAELLLIAIGIQEAALATLTVLKAHVSFVWFSQAVCPLSCKNSAAGYSREAARLLAQEHHKQQACLIRQVLLLCVSGYSWW